MNKSVSETQRLIQHVQNDLNPEWKLVLRLARSTPNGRSISEIRENANSPLLWEKVFDISYSHRVFPLVYKNIVECCIGIVSSELLECQKKRMMNLCTHNLGMSALLIKCLELFSANGIPVIPFKGPVLANILFGDMYFRTFGDLDLLIYPNDLPIILNLLEENGFSAGCEFSNAQLKKIIQTDKEYPLIHDKTGISLELHWGLTGTYCSSAMTMEDLLPECRPFSFEGREIRVFGNEDLLVYLCIHGNMHVWKQLEHVCCLAELINSKKNLDWDGIVLKARKIGCERMVSIGLLLAVQLYGANVPSRFVTSCARDHRGVDLSKNIIKRYFVEGELSLGDGLISSRFSPYHLFSMDSVLAAVRYGLSLVFYPTKYDWEVFPVPASCSFILYILRPLRLFGEFLGRVVGNRKSFL